MIKVSIFEKENKLVLLLQSSDIFFNQVKITFLIVFSKL